MTEVKLFQNRLSLSFVDGENNCRREEKYDPTANQPFISQEDRIHHSGCHLAYKSEEDDMRVTPEEKNRIPRVKYILSKKARPVVLTCPSTKSSTILRWLVERLQDKSISYCSG